MSIPCLNVSTFEYFFTSSSSREFFPLLLLARRTNACKCVAALISNFEWFHSADSATPAFMRYANSKKPSLTAVPPLKMKDFKSKHLFPFHLKYRSRIYSIRTYTIKNVGVLFELFRKFSYDNLHTLNLSTEFVINPKIYLSNKQLLDFFSENLHHLSQPAKPHYCCANRGYSTA